MLTSIVNEANATGLLRSKVYAGPAHEAEGGLLDDVRTSTQVGRSMAWMVVAGGGHVGDPSPVDGVDGGGGRGMRR